MSAEEALKKEDTKKIIDNLTPEKADKVLEEGPAWLCTVHLRLRVPCEADANNQCLYCNNWLKEHETCPKRVHKTDIVFGKIFGGKEGWVKKT